MSSPTPSPDSDAETEPDRLDWIFGSNDAAALERRYDQWADTYDDDHDGWGWVGPDLVAGTILRLGDFTETSTIHDAGCGTGKAGVALRRAGFRGRIVGLDLSQGMLDVAAATEAYDELVKCSLTELPLDDDTIDGIVSSGVFTHGHVGGEAFAELCRIARPDGLVTVTQRVDLQATFQPFSDALQSDGRWTELERTTPESLHPDRDAVPQSVVTWRIGS